MDKQIILNAISEVIKDSKCDFKNWYKYEFESDIEINKESDLTSSEFTESDIDCSIFDYIYFVIDGFVSSVCERLGILMDLEENEKQVEIIYELTKDELRKQFEY